MEYLCRHKQKRIMQKQIRLALSVIMAIAMVMVSCNKMDNVAKDEIEDPATSSNNSILSFDSEKDFLAAVQSVRLGNIVSGVSTKSTGIEDFRSLYDEFTQAMEEADEYYQREGGYEEFKAKFPDLYYPEYGEDYAAFLPVSDEAIAKLLNTDGLVKIAGKDIDYRDVWTYEKIRELGLAMPEYESPVNSETKAFSDFVTLTENRQVVNAKRKAWITRRGINYPEASVKIGRVDLCFRKKGILGWYNGKMISRSYTRTKGFAPGQYIKHYHPFFINDSSPHRYIAATRPINATSSNYGIQTLFFECGEDEPAYSFTGSFTLDIDALLDLTNGPGFWETLNITLPPYTYKF